MFIKSSVFLLPLHRSQKTPDTLHLSDVLWEYLMFTYAEWKGRKKSIYIFFVRFFFFFQYYEMSYGLNIEMHKQVCKSLIFPCLYTHTHSVWIMDSILDRGLMVCVWDLCFLFFFPKCRLFTFSYLCRVQCLPAWSVSVRLKLSTKGSYILMVKERGGCPGPIMSANCLK